jgi:proteasome accessory factor A
VAERIFGLETEYAFAALGPRGERIPSEPVLNRFMELAKELPHLGGKDSGGIFLENGSRFYIDTGYHPELATAEVANPWDACRYVLAGQRILAGLAERLVAREGHVRQVYLSCCNFSYAGRPTTWACHESYCHQADLHQIPMQLIPHLVSRLIYSGSGGFNNRSAGIEFMLSPRVAHLTCISSSDSQRSRGIYHDKDESLSREGFHRLHVLCGESVCSERAAWLKVASTALIVALIEGGLLGGRVMQLRNPLDAMLTFAADPTCSARVRTVDGRLLSAIEIQRFYLHEADAFTDNPLMPPWTRQACTYWREMLDRLEYAPGSVSKTLDWAIKLALYRDFVRSFGVDWDSLPRWNPILVQLDKTLQEKTESENQVELTADVVRPDSAIADEVGRLTPALAAQGLSWDGLDAVIRLRRELFAVETRFGQIDSEGIFASLEAAGVLDHHMPGVDNIQEAMTDPPEGSRARLRGLWVKRLNGRGAHCRCDWRGVWDFEQNRFLDLSHPLAADETWQNLAEERPAIEDPYPRLLTTLLRQAFRAYECGRFEEVHHHLERIYPMANLLDRRSQIDVTRLTAWVRSRRGVPGGEDLLDTLPEERRESLWGILDYVSVFRFRGLSPRPEMAFWVQRGMQRLAETQNPNPEAVTALVEHRGYLLLTEGRLAEARDVLEEICRPDRQTARTFRLICRGRATLGEIYRRLGDHRHAERLLEEASANQATHHFEGELADTSLTYLAKLQADRGRARSVLAEARRIQCNLANRQAEARTVLLEARLSSDSTEIAAAYDRIREIKEQVPSLSVCPLLARILARWEQWVGGKLRPDAGGDVFWGV